MGHGNNPRANSITEFIQSHILDKHSSWELQGLISCMPEHAEEAANVFCDLFELGNWFYEAMTLNEVDISEMLINLAETRRQEEKEAANDRAEADREYRQMQAGPSV